MLCFLTFCCHCYEVTGWGGLYWNVQWIRITNSAAWYFVCVFCSSHHSMESVPVTEMLCYFRSTSQWNCLQTEALTNFINIHSLVRWICKVVRSDCYWHRVCLLGMSHLPIGVLHDFFGKSTKKIQVLLNSKKNNMKFTWRPIHIFNKKLLIYF
jgi:hypothetical protein